VLVRGLDHGGGGGDGGEMAVLGEDARLHSFQVRERLQLHYNTLTRLPCFQPVNAESGSAGVSWDVFKRLQQAEAEEAEAAKTGGGAGGGNSSSRALKIAAGGDAGEEADVEVAQAQAVDWIVDLWDAAQVEWVLAAAATAPDAH
jgi:hypothetical protein